MTRLKDIHLLLYIMIYIYSIFGLWGGDALLKYMYILLPFGKTLKARVWCTELMS